jgi:uncharacterized protein (DUF486 family)
MSGMPVLAQTTLLLIGSNIFMTFARYAHLRDLNDRPWWIAALLSWGVALFCMKEAPRLDHLWAALCLVGAVFFIFRRPS